MAALAVTPVRREGVSGATFAPSIAPTPSTQPDLRVVHPIAAPVTQAVLCTADDEFRSALSTAAGHAAKVAVDEAQLGAMLDTGSIRTVVVDASIPALNPHRLARLARAHRASPSVWLMVAKRDAQSAVLSQALGVEVVTKRVRTILAVIDPRSARHAHVEAIADVLAQIGAAFVSFAGPLGAHGVQAAQDGMREGRIAPTAEAFAGALAERLRLPGPRAGFIAQARAVLDAHRTRHASS